MKQVIATALDDIAYYGYNKLARIVVLMLALLLNIGFFLPKVPSEVDGFSIGAIPGIDKVVHLGVFALTAWAIGRLLAPARKYPIGIIVAALAVYAVFIEIVQGLLLPTRSADPLDVLFDWIGIALGVAIWYFERKRNGLV